MLLKTKRKQKLFFTNFKKRDLVNLESVGTIVNLTEGTLNVFDVNSIKQELELKLNEYEPGFDFIVITGSNIITMMLGIVLNQKFGNATHNLFLWDAVNRQYKKVIMRAEF